MTISFTRGAAVIGGLVALVAAGAGCASGTSTGEKSADDCPTIVLATHDSFAVSEGTFESFTDDTCIGVDVINQGDAGELVSTALLTAGNPTADVLFGVDTTFVQRAIDGDLFEPYVSPELSTVDPKLRLDADGAVTPIDYSDVCVNYWIDALPGPAPTSLDDLANPINRDHFVTEDPETSSPGFAFMLATIAAYGEDGWLDYWEQLGANGVAITSGWTDAYFGEFVAGGGDRSLVTSYATSPPYEYLYADPPVDAPPTGVLTDGCFRQIEYAGILAGTDHANAAAKLIDFMLGTTYQSDIPLTQFVYPVNRTVTLPEAFTKFGQLAQDPVIMEPADIEANRDRWTEEWAEVVLG